MLEQLNAEPELIDRVCWLIAYHHTYSDINSMDYQILVESDFFVNAYEDDMSQDAMQSIVKKVFNTKSTMMCRRKQYAKPHIRFCALLRLRKQ